MPRMKGEPAAQDLSDIEEGGTAVARKCFNCGQVQKKAVCVVGEVRTKNYLGICVNRKCFRYVDVEKLRSWRVE